MKTAHLFYFILLAFFISSCGWLSKETPKKERSRGILKKAVWVQPVKLKNENKILIVPFSPGREVAASDKSERLSLKIVKGFADLVMDGQRGYSVLGMDDAHEAEMIIRGRIERVDAKQSGFLGFFRKEHKSIVVSGKITDADDGSLILEFSHRRQTNHSKMTFDDLALLLGRDIGKFLISAIEDQGMKK